MRFRMNALIIVVFGVVFTAYSQQVDSVSELHQRCWKLTYSAPDSSLILAKQAKRIATRKGEALNVARSNLLIGIIYDVKSRYDSAMLFHHMALRSAQEAGDTMIMASSLSNIGLTFWHVGSYYKALENFFTSLRYFEALHDDNPSIANVFNNIGLIYSELNEYHKSIGYFRKAAQIYHLNNDSLGLGATLTNIAVHYSLTGDLSKAGQMIDSAIVVKENSQDLYGLAIAYNEKASIQMKAGLNREAYSAILESLNYSTKIKDQSAQADSYHLLQQYFREQGNYNRAMRYNRIALGLAKEIEDKKLIAENYRNTSEIYKAQNDFKKAYDYFTRYIKLKDSLVDQHQLNNIYSVEFQHQLEKQQGEISQLREKQELQALKIERQEWILSKRNLQMVIIASGFVVALLFLYIRFMRSRHRHNREMVVALMRQRNRQARKIIDAEFNERKRVSQELHDSLGQLLSLIKMKLSSQQGKKGSGLESVDNHNSVTLILVDQAIAELRNISQNMTPILLKEKGLKVAIGDMVQRLINISHINIDLETHELDKLDDELIESTIYSVIQESLNNAVKHAECNKIDVQVICGEKEVSVMIEDNGKGFSVDEIDYGLGLHQIETKVTNLEGTVNIDSMKGRGTIVNIEIPILKIFEI